MNKSLKSQSFYCLQK